MDGGPPEGAPPRSYAGKLKGLSAVLIVAAASYLPIKWAVATLGVDPFRERAQTEHSVWFMLIGITIGVVVTALCSALLVRKRIFRPRKATLAGAFMFYMLMPIGTVGLAPSCILFFPIFYFSSMPKDEHSPWMLTWLFIGAPIFSYLISSILVTGIGSVGWRFFAFCQVWWGVYATISYFVVSTPFPTL
jgi:hypothetical protein